MGKIETMKAEMPIVSLRSIVPAMTKDENEKLQFMEDLSWIGFEGLLAQPWSLRSEEMAREFLQERSNE